MESTKTPHVGTKLRAGLVLVAALGMLGMMPTGASARDASCGHGAGSAPSIHAVAPAVPGAILVGSEGCPECPAEDCSTIAACSPALVSDVPRAVVIAPGVVSFTPPLWAQRGEAISTTLPPPTPPPE